METRINRLPLTHLWNSEYVIFVNQLITILDKYEPEVLHLKKAFERIIAMLPDLGKIKAKEQKQCAIQFVARTRYRTWHPYQCNCFAG